MNQRDRWNERYSATALVWSEAPNALLADLAGAWKPGRALDVAAGEGRNAIWLAQQGWLVDAVDFSAVGIGKGQQLAAQRQVDVNWIVADVCDCDFGLAQYDLVCVLFLHTSAEERDQWWPRLVAAVKPGGRLVYIGHDPENVDRGIGGPQDKALLPSIELLKPWLTGCEIDRAEIIERPVETDPGHGGPQTGRALDTLIVARKRASH